MEQMVERFLKQPIHSFSENIMKQTSKQKEETEKKQTQVNGKPTYENGKLVTPKNDKKIEDKKTTPKKEPKPIVKPEVTVASFLMFLKKNLDEISESESTQGYTRIKIGKRVYCYAKDSQRKCGVIIWNQVKSETEFIGKKKDFNTQLKAIQTYQKVK